MGSALLAVYRPLTTTPLLWLTATLLAFVFGHAFQKLCKGSPLANPVMVAIVALAILLEITSTPYATYFAGAQFIHFLLGPATVALAIPLALNLRLVRRSLRSVGFALVAGSLTSTLSGVAMVRLLGGNRTVALSMAPKSVTTPVAMALAQDAGGIVALTAALAIAGGIVAAVIGRTLFRWLKVDDWRAQGLAAGVSGSGVAAAQIAPASDVAAAFAAMGIALNAILSAIVVPIITWWWPS